MENKKESMMDEMKDGIAKDLISTILPKVTPFIKPAVEKLENYLGDNEKFIVIRRSSKNRSAMVIVLDANGEYEISRNDEKENGLKVFNVTEGTNEHIININEFISKLLSGDFK